MREIAEIELAIQGGTEKIETLGTLYVVLLIMYSNISAGEQGKVEESMREMAAIEALKTEKADKEVRHSLIHEATGLTLYHSESFSNSRTRQELRAIRNCGYVTSVVHTFQSSTPTVVSRTTLVAK